MVSYQHVLLASSALFSVSTSVSRQQWRNYVDELRIDQFYPGIQAIGFAKLVARDKRDAFIQSMHHEGFTDFTVRPISGSPVYTPIVYIEPFLGTNLRAFGYDMFSDSTRRLAMEHARDSAAPSISGKVTLILESQQSTQVGTVMYMPVYRKEMPIETVSQRRLALDGYIFSAFRMSDLMQGILGERNPLINLEIYDGLNVDPRHLMYDSHPEIERVGLLQRELRLDVGGQVWTLAIGSTPQFEASIDNKRPEIIIIGGLLITGLLFGVLWSLSTSRIRALGWASRMTQHLRESEERYVRAITGANDGIWDWELESGRVFYSPRFIEMTGYLPQEFSPVTASLEQLLHPDDRLFVWESFIAHWKQLAPFDIEVRLKNKRNGYRYFRFKGQATFGADSRAVSMAGSISDVTDRKQAESALRASEQRFRTLVENAPVGIFVTDTHGNHQFFNAYLEELSGITSARASNGGWVATVHSEDRPRVIHEAKMSIAEQRDSLIEFRYQKADGTEAWVSSTAARLMDENGNITGYIGIVFDLTERMRVDRMKNEFISTVSHELRTPLTSIRGSLGLLAAGTVGEIPARAQAMLDIAKNNCERLARLINDILDIEKIESGNIQVKHVTQRMLPLVEQAIGATQSFAAQYRVKIELQPDAADAYVSVDADRITQVIVNLLSNAAKFSPSDTIVEVSLRYMPGCVRLVVKDKGPGIQEEFRERIFQKFAQADSSDTRQKGGTGLGLSISKAIIEKHQGRIDFHSVPGLGSEFYFDLPLAAAPVQVPKESARVLICEDNQDGAELLRLMLLQAGMSSDIARDTDEARRFLASGTYEAMTLGLSLPGEDGIALLRWMRGQEKTRGLPVVIVSASAEPEFPNSTRGAVGVVDWIDKPIDPVRLLAALQNATRQNKNDVPSILHVEDDLDLVNVVAALLDPAYKVVHAATLEDARSKLAMDDFSLILLDLNLTDGHGSELLASLPDRNASTPVVLFSGEEASRSITHNVHAALVKSRTSNEQLLTILNKLIGKAPVDNSFKEDK